MLCTSVRVRGLNDRTNCRNPGEDANQTRNNTIGVTAPFAALRLANPAHRKAFILWQVLGITDLVNALALGALAGVIDPHGIPTAAMTVLPMSYIPTFAVPLFLILHIICIAQARRWPVTHFAATGNSFQTPMPQGQE